MKILAIVLVVMGVFLGEVVTAQQAAPASLEGTVVQFGTDTPLRGATVDLRTDSGRSVGVTTDGDGKFVFPNVQPGRYRLLASYPGFVRAEYGLRAGEIPNWRRVRPSPVLTVEAGQKRTGLRIVMTPGAIITGRVIDQGEPVSGLIVSAVRVSYESGGQTFLSQFLSGATNDLGEYHIFWLPPGLYYVRAAPNDVQTIIPPVMFINPTDGAENPLFSRGAGWIQMGRAFGPREGILFVKSARLSDTEMHVPMFFPGKADWRDATLIQISPGEEVRNVDINADPVPALHIRGTVEGVPPLVNARGGPIRTQLALFAAVSPASGSISSTAFASASADANGRTRKRPGGARNASGPARRFSSMRRSQYAVPAPLTTELPSPTDAHDRHVLAEAAEALEDYMNELSSGVDPGTHRGVSGWAAVLDTWIDLLDSATQVGDTPSP